MTYKVPLPLIAAFLLSSTLAAQQGAEQAAQQLTAQQMSANAFAAAQRLADCARANDLACYQAMVDHERLPPPVNAQELDIDPRVSQVSRLLSTEPDSFRWTDVAEPWPPIASDGAIFIFVPTFSTYGVERLGLRVNWAGYLLGASDDGGETWRFVPVSRYPQTRPDAVDRLIPGYGDGPRPEVLLVYIEENPFESSPWLRTTERHFALADGGFAYALKFEIRKRIREPINVTVRYENPADRGQYFRFQGSLDPGQSELQWRSQALNFEVGETYNVVIEGSDRDTGELLFEHRESLLFQPTRELWLSAMSQPPASTSDAAPRPFVVPGDSLAQVADLSAIDAAARDAERYVDCWRSSNRVCAQYLIDRELFDEAGLSGNAVIRVINDVIGTYRHDFYSIEVTQPWEPFASGDRLVTYVPYYETIVEEPEGRRYDLMSYLIARSSDNGNSWRFFKIEGTDLSLTETFDRLIPGAAQRPQPAVIERHVQEPELARSRSLQTSGRRFIPVDDGYVYAMKWDLRREFEGALNLAIRYDNPAERGRPLNFRGSLGPGQRELEWTSPVLTGLEAGEEYEVVVEAIDADTGELLFEHRQSLLFQPTRELWLSVMSQQPDDQPE